MREKYNMSNVIATYSIVGCDPAAGEVGIAVQSKYLAVGNVVPCVKGGVGAVATQAWANTSYGPNGLALLEQGLHPQEIVERLTREDDGAGFRQMGIVDAAGRSATFTGKDCNSWAGGIAGENHAAQGNILVGEETVHALSETFLKTSGDLTTRLMESLAAGQKAGGDRRGMQSAALYVAKPGAGYGGYNDKLVDIRVDDHKTPIEELRRILGLYRFYGFKTKENNISKIEGESQSVILDALIKNGFYNGATDIPWDDAMHEAFDAFSHRENFEGRLTAFGMVDNEVLDFIKENY